MRAHQGTSPRAIQRRTLRSIRATWRRAQTASRGAIAIPLCPAGRDMARRLRHQVSSSLRPASTECESAVLALGGASVGRASFHQPTAGA